MSKFWVMVLGTAVSYLLLRYRRPIKEFVGNIAFAERILGSGGTNTFIVLLGIGTFVLSLMYATGSLQAILGKFLGPFF